MSCAVPPSAGAQLGVEAVPHDLREEEGIHRALDALRDLVKTADEVS
jgi:hypothetical protein